MAKTYYLKFGSGDPRSNTGLFPTMVIFAAGGVTSVVGPTISELPTGSGLYQFIYGPTQAVSFLADGGAALSTGDRYIAGVLDPIQAVDEKVGLNTDSYGATATDPSTVFGYIRRLVEFLEGDAIYTKSSGIWQLFSRGSSTLLRQKTLVNNTTQSTKS